MIKVFLVEDEFVIREGIKNNIDWAANGYEFCGEARDGELAFPMIQKLQPDIVITDIRMPFMDGLTLSRLIKKELPATEIIILSGYEEFGYAKEAIEIGVAKYLTKPISSEDFLREINELAEKINEQKQALSLQEKYRQEMEENSHYEQKNFFSELVSGKRTMPELLELAGKCEIELSALWYNIILVQIRSLHHEAEEYSGSLVRIFDYLEELTTELGIQIFDRDLEGKALLFRADSMEQLLEQQKQFVSRAEKFLEGYPQVRYFGGIGSPVERMTELSASFDAASRAFAHRYFVTENRFEEQPLTEPITGNLGNDTFDIKEVDLKQVDKTRLEEFLKLGTPEEVGYFVEEYTSGIGDDFIQSLMFRQYILMDVYFAVAAFLEKLGYGRDAITPLDITSGVLQNADKARDYMINIIGKAIELRTQTAGNRNSETVDAAIAYLQEHFAEEELSLNTLASHVNVSPNHLSMLFSQETGQTFIKYLTDFRMNRAKELLRGSSLRSNEIGAAVGYHDPHYFSYLFKKTQGMTPTQFRGKGEE